MKVNSLSDCVKIYRYTCIYVYILFVRTYLKVEIGKRKAVVRQNLFIYLFTFQWKSFIRKESPLLEVEAGEPEPREPWLKRPRYVLIQGVNEGCYIMIKVLVRNRNVKYKVLYEIA